MPVTLHLVRHAQGFHNLSAENEALPDPDLTELGNKQCAGVRASFPAHDKLTHLVASPMRRTIYTCLQSFGPSDDDDFQRTALLPVLALPEIQEVSDNPCDTGSDVARLEEEFRGKVDFSRVPADWTEKKLASSPWEPTVEKLEVRARKARIALRELARQSSKEDVHIAAVTHGGFLHFLTDDWFGVDVPNKGKWLLPHWASWRVCDADKSSSYGMGQLRVPRVSVCGSYGRGPGCRHQGDRGELALAAG